MTEKRIVYIVSRINKSLAFEWIAAALKNDNKLSFILLNPSFSALEGFLSAHQVEVKRIRYRGKVDLVSAFIKVFYYLLFKRPHIVHAHLLDAQLIGLTAAKVAGIRRRIYTRHNSNFHHEYHPRAVRLDVWSNRMATDIVSISQATDSVLALERVPTSKIVKIRHGFNLDDFLEVQPHRVSYLREKWKIEKNHPIVGVIARHIEWKGIQYIIPAFLKFLTENPSACLVLANASGPYHDTIVEMIRLIPSQCVKLIPFEEDVAALYSTFDLYVHVPVDPLCEAFGQTYVEALAVGIPSIFTLSGIAVEFIENEKNAIVVNFRNDDEIFRALKRLWKDDALQKRLVDNGKENVISQFGIEQMLSSLRTLYGA